MKKKQKLAVGGNVTRYVKTPNEALMENEIALARAQQTANSNGWVQGLDMFGGLAMQYGMSMAGGADGVVDGAAQGFGQLFGKTPTAALGGKVGDSVGVEVEGEEVAETPQGDILEFEGASHAQGGIDVDLPEGTDVYSKQVKGPDGKSMADRKLKRERKEEMISKLFDKAPSDRLLEKTLERTKSNNMITEKRDKQKMEMVRMLMGSRDKMAYGGTIDNSLIDLLSSEKPKDPNNPYGDMSDQDFLAKAQVFLQMNQEKPALSTPGIVGEEGNSNFLKMFSDMFNPEGGSGGITGGDLLGLFGQFKAGTDPMKNTLENRAGDTPNINAFENFGQDALNTNEEAQGYVAGQRDSALQDLSRASVGSKSSNRNSARGVNTQRALDLSTDMAANQSREKIFSDFSKQMMDLLDRKSGLQNEKDFRVMTGEDVRDDRDRQDRDAFYSQMAEDLGTKNLMLQNMGKNLNSMKERTVTQNLINQLSEHGLKLDSKGNIVGMDKK